VRKGLRIGLGYDVHPFAEGRPLRLAGIDIPSERGLAGHSDGDAVCHAVADALLGALALGDLGGRFPADDPKWSGADSGELLRLVWKEVAGHGARIVNVDVVLVAEEPPLSPHLGAMRKSLAAIVEVDESTISIKPKRSEGVALGGGHGVAAQAVVLLSTG
jgi:2-C-methyl-D-erythritol 2,4-cyclodiphosphate synthase